MNNDTYKLHFESDQFIKDWKAAGDNETDLAYRFFDYFVVFNYIYEHFYYDNKTLYSHSFPGRKYHEPSKIEFFISELWDDLHNNGFEPWKKLSESSEMVVKPVDGGEHNVKRDRIHLYMKDMETAIDIMMNVYGIRCNLFHGDKHMERLRSDAQRELENRRLKKDRQEERDESLVLSGISILKNLLESFISLTSY